MKLRPRLKPNYNHREILAALTPSRGAVPEFEEAFARKFGCSFGVMFPYGRSGLLALIQSLGLQSAEIICPAYTCVVVAHAIVLSGNIPVFVDCAKGSFNMGAEGVRQAVTEKTRMIIATHLFGYPMNVTELEDMVRKAEEKFGHKIYLVQDAAHSFGAKWEGRLVTASGDAAIFGLGISKIINSIFGGMVITRHEKIFNDLKSYREKNFVRPGVWKSAKRLAYLLSASIAFNPYVYRGVHWLDRKGFLNPFTKYYDESRIDFPQDWKEGPVELEARVGLEQLKKYDGIIERRVRRARQYIQEFQDRKDLSVPPFVEGATYSHFVAQVPSRDQWVKEYFNQGIELGILIEYCVPNMKAYRPYKQGDYPQAEAYAESLINFPIWTDPS